MAAANSGSMRNSAFSQFRQGWRDAAWSWYFSLFLIPTMTLVMFLDVALEGTGPTGQPGLVMGCLAFGAGFFSLARAMEITEGLPIRVALQLRRLRPRTLRRFLTGTRILGTTAVGVGALGSLVHPPLHTPLQAMAYLVTFTLLCLFCVRMYLELGWQLSDR